VLVCFSGNSGVRLFLFARMLNDQVAPNVKDEPRRYLARAVRKHGS
jgi:hypothetical protein